MVKKVGYCLVSQDTSQYFGTVAKNVFSFFIFHNKQAMVATYLITKNLNSPNITCDNFYMGVLSLNLTLI